MKARQAEESEETKRVQDDVNTRGEIIIVKPSRA